MTVHNWKQDPTADRYVCGGHEAEVLERAPDSVPVCAGCGVAVTRREMHELALAHPDDAIPLRLGLRTSRDEATGRIVYEPDPAESP